MWKHGFFMKNLVTAQVHHGKKGVDAGIVA
jgi:hypothetical protein